MIKALMVKRKIDLKDRELAALRAKETEYAARAEQLGADIAALEQIDEETEAAVTAFDEERTANKIAMTALEGEIEALRAELAAIEAEDETPAAEERSEETMNTPEIRTESDFTQREDVRAYLGDVRGAIREKRALTNVGLTIPEIMLGLIRKEIAHASRLLPYVTLRSVGGVARQNIAGAIPEAVWTEMCANLNELSLSFNQIEVDGYKVGGYIAVCNATLEDSDVALANEIITAIGGAIGKALDKAILFGTGTKMPVGIVTRLAQESQPASWGTYAPAWVDLHTSNIKTLNIDGSTGAAFFSTLIENLAIAKPVYSSEGLVWVMNRKTHLHLMAKALQFDSSAALVSNTTLMPVIGGTVIEFEDDEIADNEIIGGFFGNYLMAERAGIQFASSDIPLFLADQTVFKGTARYDGMPIDGKAFVLVNFANTTPTKTADFPADEANSVQSIRLSADTLAITGTATKQLYAFTAPGSGTVTWASSVSAKATVSSTGLVTGVTSGTTVVTATCNGLTASCTVTVS